MKKATKKLNIGLLMSENIPQLVGNEGDDPIVRHLKKLHAKDPNRADLFFEKMHNRLANRKGFEWLERVREKRVK